MLPSRRERAPLARRVRLAAAALAGMLLMAGATLASNEIGGRRELLQQYPDTFAYDNALEPSAVTRSVVEGRDPDVDRDAMGLVTSKGYSAEWHDVETRDGYILRMLRITGAPLDTSRAAKAKYGTRGCIPTTGSSSQQRRTPSPSKPVVLLQHGLIDSAATWVLNGPTQSLGFVLADLGFDVWYARTHTLAWRRQRRR